MPSQLSLWMQADPRESSWYTLISTEDVRGIEDRILAMKPFTDKELLREGLLDAAWFGGKATVETFLRRGAPVDCRDRDDRTPLLRSIERNDDETVALSLIEHGADVNAQEYAGRTPLMQCIWRNRMEVFNALLERWDIDVEIKDRRGRNALHHLATDLDRADEDSGQPSYDAKTPHNKDILDGLINKSPMILESKDEYDRTCLHWAALYGNSRLVELVVQKRQRAKHRYDNRAFSVTDYQGRSPIHVAAAKEHFSIVMIMLHQLSLAPDEQYACINDTSVGNWTILLLVLRSPKAPLDLVQKLIGHGADVNICVQDGKNALHLAALNGNYDVIKLLLHQQGMERSKRDDFGDTPLLCIARYALDNNKKLQPEERKKLLLLFAPWKDPFQPKGEAEKTAKHHRPVIYVFDKQEQNSTGRGVRTDEDPNSYRRETWRELESSTPLSIYDLIYADDRDRPDDPFIPTVSKDNASFKWIHLPANSIPWCLDLVSKHFIEHALNGDIHGLQELERAFAHHERHNKDPHFSYMTPICETISTSQSTGAAVVGRPPLQASSFTVSQFTAPGYNARRSSGGGAFGIHRGIQSLLEPPLRITPPLFGAENTFPWRSSPSQTNSPKDDTAAEKPNGEQNELLKLLTTMTQTIQGSPTDKSDTKVSSMFLFMPYLHHEFTSHQINMCELAEKISKEHSKPYHKARAPQDGTMEQIELLRSHSVSSDTMSLHLRRTLDQYFYQHIDTKERDLDQVFQRDQVQGDPKMATAETTSWLARAFRGQAPEPARARLRAAGAGAERKETAVGQQCRQLPRLRTLMVDQLWMLVLSNDLVITCCPAPWNAPAGEQSDMLRRVVDFIRSNNNNEVGSVWELALLIVGQFYGSHCRLANEDKYEFLNIFKKALGVVKDNEIKMLKRFKPEPSVSSTHLQKLIEVQEETTCLNEVKDIADELGILDMVLLAQKHVHGQMMGAYDHMIKHDDVYRGQRAYKIFTDHFRAIELPHEEVLRMAGQSAKIEQAILALLDLKQKHANALQAYSTARSGTTLLIFTIVTIIFLPLTFISSFFTMELTEYPRDETGVSLPAAFVMTYIFGIGMPIAAALVIMALFAGWTNSLFYGILQRILRLDKPNTELSPIRSRLKNERLFGASDDHPHAPVRSITYGSIEDDKMRQYQARMSDAGSDYDATPRRIIRPAFSQHGEV